LHIALSKQELQYFEKNELIKHFKYQIFHILVKQSTVHWKYWYTKYNKHKLL